MMFRSSFVYDAEGILTVPSVAAAVITSLVLGLVISLTCRFKNRSGQSLPIALLILPVVVQVVIMMVNGEVGTGVAVMGAFSLIRFRSVPGSAKDIALIFLAMAVGLANGMGYLWFSAAITVIVCAIMIAIKVSGYSGVSARERDLRITIPENLDYTTVFDEIFKKYTDYCDLTRTRTTNMGSLFELRYRLRIKKGASEKKFIDELRCRNGNLAITLGHIEEKAEDLTL